MKLWNIKPKKKVLLINLSERLLAEQGVCMQPSVNKKLTRGSTFIAGGVCAGMARYYERSKGGVQAAFVVGSLFFGSAIILYLILWCTLSKES